MNDNQNERPSPEALFRFHLMGAICAALEAGRAAAEAIARLAARRHVDLRGQTRRLSERTLYRWLARWKAKGLPGLEPEPRERVKGSAVLSDALVGFCRDEREQDPDVSVPQLVKRARERGVIASDLAVDRVTLWRAMKRMGVSTSRRTRQAQRDMHRFVYPNRMLMVLADGKRFRAGVARLRRVAMIFIDDATRYVLGVLVGLSETCQLFLSLLFHVLLEYGLMNTVYLDRGSGFTADDTARVCGALKIPIIFGEAGYPEGHGKIERFNRTLLSSTLRSYDNNPDVDPDPRHLTLRLQLAIDEYNHTPHEGLDGARPHDRWMSDPRPLHPVPSLDWLRHKFRLRLKRTVSADNVVSYDGVPYEMPRGYAGQKVFLQRSPIEPGLVELCASPKAIRLQPVDPVSNAYQRRQPRHSEPEAKDPSNVVATASDLAFQQDFAPLVDDDGGFPERSYPDANQDQVEEE